jgi:oligopeptide transport system substrate-binding protein
MQTEKTDIFLFSQKNAGGRCLRINFKEEPSSLDPRRGRSMSGSSQLHAMLFEGLMHLNPDGSLSCAQAHSYDISTDKKTYTFYLKDTRWSDGTPVTAYDFERTWKDTLEPSFPSLDAHVLFCIKNAKAAKKGALSIEQVGIYAKDAKTLIVELEHPTLHFLQITACSSLFPINQTQAQRFPDWHLEAGAQFVGNGPFKLTLWKHHREMLLEKNKHYHQANKIKLDSIHVSMINKGMAALQIHNSGLFDIIGLPISTLPFDLYREMLQQDLLHIVKTPGTAACLFNTAQFPFTNINMRKAFTYAINRQQIIETITLLKEDPALGFMPPSFKKNKATPFFKDNHTHLARACFQKGLEELGVSVGDLERKLAFCFWKQDHGCPLLPQALQQQWLSALGVKVEIEALEYNSLHEKGSSGDFSMGYFVFLSLYHDSISLLERFQYVDSPRNYARWQNDNYTQLLKRSAESPLQEERSIFLDQAEEVLMQDMPFAPLFHWNYALLVQPHVKGFAISPLGYLCFDRINKLG